MMVLEHARTATVQDPRAPGHYRWTMLRAILRHCLFVQVARELTCPSHQNRFATITIRL
jgi:hypothetical protein